MTLSEDDHLAMTVPAWRRAQMAIEDGEFDAARLVIEEAAIRSQSLQDYSINWITSLLSFIGRELGEEAVERALRTTGEEFIRARRGPTDQWWALDAEVRARAIATAMVANGSECDVEERDDEIVLSFRCGSGGKLIDEGSYEDPDEPGDGYLVLREAGPRTFGRDELPVYCAHCSINNELQPIEWDGLPVTIESPPAAAGDRCVHHVHRHPNDIPAEVFIRLGVEPPG